MSGLPSHIGDQTAYAMAKALGVEDVGSVRAVTLYLEAGRIPMMTVERYVFVDNEMIRRTEALNVRVEPQA